MIGKREEIASPAWPDDRLVAACREGDAEAWSAILEKYRRLIYSIPSRYGLQPDDAADVFQAVCLDLYSELDTLREPAALRGWLIRVALNKCYHLRRKSRREPLAEDLSNDASLEPSEPATAPEWLEELERRHIVHSALDTLSDRCRGMIRMLFFETPPRPYEEVAAAFGLATGSIGFIRGRCLKALQKILKQQGL